MTRRYTGGFLSATEQVTDANTANGIFSVQDAGALTAAGLFPTGRWTPQRSIRFRRANKGYFSRTPGTAGNRRTWTWSAWVKQTNLTNGAQPYFTASNDYANGTYSTTIYYNGSSFKTRSYEASTEIFALETTAQYRDPSAWYHLVISVDTTHAIQSQRVKMYVNGIQQTAFDQATYPSTADYDTYVNSTAPHRIGSYPYGAGFDDQYYMDGYMSEYNLIDGQALTPYAFGMTDPETGTWVPKRYTGSYGTNGFYLDFRDNSASTAAAIGADRSGNGNNWTPNLISLSGVTSTTTSYTTVGSTTFTPPANVSSVSYLVVAGGGAGGSAGPNMYDGGAAGGGAGGMLQGTLAVTPGTPYTVTVGGAGTGASNRTRGASGSNSVFGSFTAIGGGGGGGGANTTSGANGGSGGGGANGGVAGTGTAGQGNDGGYYVGSPGNGGGGKGSVGGSATNNNGAAGGTGATSDISGSTVTYAAGGGGGGYQLSGGAGGSSGVGGAGGSNNSNGSNASSYGSGGGGSGGTYNTSGTLTGGNGSQGIVIISYSVPDSTYDSYVDVPGIASTSSQTDFGGVTRGNYATLNPIDIGYSGVLSEGNLKVSTASASNVVVASTMALTTNTYCEVTIGSNLQIGLLWGRASDGYGGSALSMMSSSGGSSGVNVTRTISATPAWTNGETLGFAWNHSSKTLTLYQAGLPTAVMTMLSSPAGDPLFAISNYTSGAVMSGFVNFGQRPFKYAPPTGFKSLNTTNLPNPIIKRPSDHFDVKTWTGNGTGLTVGTTVKQSSAYAINKSLRFRKANSAYLSRTPSTTGNQKTWTWSGWVKQSLFGTSGTQWLLTSGNSGSISTNYTILSFSVNGFLGNANQFQFYSTLSNSTVCAFESSQKFADPAEWCNVVLAVDTTQVVPSQRVRMYVDGVQITSFATATYPGLSVDIPFINSSSYETRIGGIVTYGSFDGYMTEVNFVDGQALTPSSFGAFDGNNNWVPQRYAGTYGTQGYYLPFTGDSSFYGSFNGSSQSLQATLPATLTGAFTVEFFLYRSGTGNQFCFTLGDSNTSTGLEYYIGTTGTVNNVYSNGAQISTSSNVPVANAWNHVAITRDSSNVIRLFVNGTQAGSTWTTSAAFSSTLRMGVEFYNSAVTGYVNGGLSNFRIVNGTALYTSTFTPPTSALTAVSGTAILTLQSLTIIDNSSNSLSITNNGTVVTSQAYPFTMTGNQSRDYSSQGNNWTNNNIGVLAGSTLDIMIDSPTDAVDSSGNINGSYCTLDSTFKGSTYIPTISNGALTAQAEGNSQNPAMGTLTVTSGKWYYEVYIDNQAYSPNIGWTEKGNLGTGDNWRSLNNTVVMNTFSGTGYVTVTSSNGSTGTQVSQISSGTYAWTTGNTVMVALDADAKKVWFGKNGTWLTNSGVGNPGTGEFPTAQYPWNLPMTAAFDGSNVSSNKDKLTYNFGQQPFAYTLPTGFKALNTKNLKDVGSYNLPDTFGNFVNTPDLVWIKNRTGANNNALFDTVRGGTNRLYPDSTVGNQIETTTLTQFIPNGFSVASAAAVNAGSNNYVGWSWNRGKTPGFDIVSYAGDGVNSRMIPHNLGVTPAFYITKCLTSYNNSNSFNDWSVYHQSCPTYTGNSRQGKQALWLHSILGAANGVGGFFTNASNTEFSPNQTNYDNSSGQSYIAYLWAEVPGFSKFGSYTGNNANDGPFVYLGFRPRFILLKKSGEASTTYGWQIYDTARSPINVAYLPGLWADTYAAEAPNTYAIDLVSNGFKLKSNNLNMNNTSTFIYAAFAETPFKYANAR